LTLGVIAGAVFVSSCHLSHLFSRHTGKALMGYVLERRLDKAREMLKSTSLSISEKSETLGFASLTHFSSCFNKKIGLSPSSNRKNLLNKQYLKD
jgi:two-component system response regulator YesN